MVHANLAVIVVAVEYHSRQYRAFSLLCQYYKVEATEHKTIEPPFIREFIYIAIFFHPV